MRFPHNLLLFYGGWKTKAATTAGNSKIYTLMNNKKNSERCYDVARLIDSVLDRKNRKNRVVI